MDMPDIEDVRSTIRHLERTTSQMDDLSYEVRNLKAAAEKYDKKKLKLEKDLEETKIVLSKII